MADVTPAPAPAYSERVQQRLREETLIWLTSVARDGTPRPSLVWFLWEDAGFVVYNRASARRLGHIRRRPQVSLHFNSNSDGGDVVVFTGLAELADDLPPADRHPLYVRKYRFAMIRVAGSPEQFASAYPTPIRIRPTGVRA